MAVYMIASPLFGVLGDRRIRPRLVTIGIVIWSLATALGGVARSFGTLLVSRAFVGVGEASYATIAPGLLSDLFPAERRGRVFSIFFAATPIGAALGYILGGLIGQHFGWRHALLMVGLPGVLLAFAVLTLRDPRRTGGDAPVERAFGYASYVDLLRNRAYLFTVLGYAAYTFSVGAVAFWMPAFLERVHHATRQQATIQFGLIVVITGFVGTFAGGWFGDLLERKRRGGEALACSIVSLLSLPMLIAAFYSDVAAVSMVGLVVAQLLLFSVTGPVNSAMIGVVSPSTRTRAMAMSVFLIHLLGDVPSPPLIGVLSDHSSLRTAFVIIPVGVAAAAWLWFLASRATARLWS